MKEIDNRRSIRKYTTEEISDELIKELVVAATLAPSAKNRQPWKFIVYKNNAKAELVNCMKSGINREKLGHEMMPNWANGIPDAENTVRIMDEAPVLIVVLNTNGKTPFSSIDNEKRIVEICDSLSIGAAIENLILEAESHDIGTLWIANTCFAYNELVNYIGTDDQLIGIIAIGHKGERPPKRWRKNLDEVLQFRG